MEMGALGAIRHLAFVIYSRDSWNKFQKRALPDYTLNLNNITSPSFTTYSLPSMR